MKMHPFFTSLSLLIVLLSMLMSACNIQTTTAQASAVQTAHQESWQIIPGAQSPLQFNQLNGIAAISNNNVWAVGTSTGENVQQSLIERWDGKVWRVVPSPQHAVRSQLEAVAAIPGTTQAWAVGTQFTPTNGYQPLIERWNGKVWQVIPNPLITGGKIGPYTNILNSVVALSQDNAWATGVYGKSSSQEHVALIEHWNGKQWSIVPNPAASSAQYSSHLFGIAAASANNIWTVGLSFYVPPSNDQPISKALVEHWNGHTWQLVPAQSPSTATNDLMSVAFVPGTNQLWTVGEFQNTAGRYQALIERWNGKSWQVIPAPTTGHADSRLLSITALSASNAWASGSLDTLVRWNGKQWSVVSHPLPSTPLCEFTSITDVPGTDTLWAVGDYYTSNNSSQSTLIERYS